MTCNKVNYCTHNLYENNMTSVHRGKMENVMIYIIVQVHMFIVKMLTTSKRIVILLSIIM